MPFIIGGAIAAGGSLLSGIIGGGAAKSAAAQSAAAQDRATQALNARFSVTQNTLSPFVTAGTNLLPAATDLALSGPTGGGPDYVDYARNWLNMAGASVPGTMTQTELENTPGYQFTKQQGLQAVQNSAAARGLGVSGAAMKGAAAYATGLADSTYKDQFAIQQQRYSDMLGMGTSALGLNTAQQGNLVNQYNRLSGLIGTGESAGAQTGQIGASLGNAAANTITGAGAAQAAGTVGAANALGGGIQGIGSNILNAQILSRLGPQGGSGTTGGFNLFGQGGLFGQSSSAPNPSADPRGIFTQNT